MKFKKLLSAILICSLAFSLMACGNNDNNTKTANSSEEKKTITVGTSPTLKGILTAAKSEYDKDGYTLDIKVFDDYVIPNTALQEGSIDMNFYQHEPYLNQFNKTQGTSLEKYGTGVLKYYMGIYSNKIKNLNELKDGDTVSIPNDTSNRVRALKVLQANKLIKLKDGVDNPTKLDIVENKKNLNIVEMEVLKLVTSLTDVDCSVINSIVATQGNIDPKSALGLEEKAESDKYSIIIVLEKDSKNQKSAERLQKSLKSEKVKKYLEEEYKGAIVTLF